MLKAKQDVNHNFVHLCYRRFKRKEIDTYFLNLQSYSWTSWRDSTDVVY